MSARPDLEGMDRSLDVADAEGWSDHAPNDYLADSLRDVIAYALALEQAAAEAKERLTALETAIDNLFRVEAIDVEEDGTLEIASTARLLDAIVDLMNVRAPTPGAAS